MQLPPADFGICFACYEMKDCLIMCIKKRTFKCITAFQMRLRAILWKSKTRGVLRKSNSYLLNNYMIPRSLVVRKHCSLKYSNLDGKICFTLSKIMIPLNTNPCPHKPSKSPCIKPNHPIAQQTSSNF